MNKRFFRFTLIVILTASILACGTAAASAPPESPNECAPLAIEVYTLPLDNSKNWVDLGIDGQYRGCGIGVYSIYTAQMSYKFNGAQGNYTEIGQMLKVSFSDGSVKYFKSSGKHLYMATE